MKRARLALMVGLLVLVIALTLYLYLGYAGIKYKEYLDDSSPWFHRHVVSYLRGGGDPYRDTWLWYPVGRNLYRTPIYLDAFLAGLGVSDLGLATLLMGIVYILAIYLATLAVFNDHVAAGLSSLILATVPATLYWMKYTMYGSYILQPIALLSTLLIAYGFSKNNAAAYSAGAAALGLLWMLWGSGWFPIIVYALYMLVLVYSGHVEKKHLAAALLMIVVAAASGAATMYAFITYYHVFSLILLILAAAAAWLEYAEFIARSGGEHIRVNMWRLTGVVSVIALAVSATYILSLLIEAPGLPEMYVKEYEPLRDYISLVFLAPFAVLLLMRSQYLSEPWKNTLPYILTIGFVAGVFASYVDPSLTVYTAASITPFIAYSLYRTLVFSYISPEAKWIKILYSSLILWVIAGSLAANIYPAYAGLAQPPAVYYTGIPEDTETPLMNKSGFLDIMNIIRNTSGNVYVVAYWDYSYWIVELGHAHTLADSAGPEEGKRLISQIFLSNEYTAWGLINETIKKHDPNATVYILLVETLSLGRSFLGGQSAYIGRPITLPPKSPEQPPDVRFIPLGDTARIPIYIQYSGYPADTYLDPRKAEYLFEYPLAWNNLEWSETKHGGVDYTPLMIRMLTYAMKKEGYRLSNKVLELHGVSSLEIEGPKYFKLVKVDITPLYHVEAGVFEYTVAQAYILYKI